MPCSLTKEQKAEVIDSLQRYFAENFDGELSQMKAGFLLEYFLKEIAPFAYNQGVEDARQFIATATADLPGTCFDEAMTYWRNQKEASRAVRRRPN